MILLTEPQWSKFANVDEIATACSSEGMGDGDETAVQDCVGVYCTEEADDNDIGSLPSPKLPPFRAAQWVTY